MGYAQAFRLLVAGYKKIKGKMPEGLDLLKIKQEARKKVIDTNKVIKVNFDKANNWMKAKPQGLEKLIKKGDVKIGQAPKTTKRKPAVDPKLTQEENIKNIMAENKAAAKRLQEKMNKPEKSLSDKLKDYKGDPDAMREGGLLGYAVGGRIQNLRNAYQANPTLQNQFTEDQYLDLFDRETITTPTGIETITSNVIEPTAPIITPPIVKPLIIPGSESDGGVTPPGKNYGYSGPSMTMADIGEGTITKEEENYFQLQGLKNLLSKTLTGRIFMGAKKEFSNSINKFQSEEKARAIKEAEEKAEALRSLNESIARNRARAEQQDWSGSSDSYSGGMDTSTGNYDDPYDPGQTE